MQGRGAIVLSGMAVIWCVLTSFTLPVPWRFPLIAAALLVSGALFMLAVKRKPVGPAKFDRRIFWLSVAFEAVATFAAIRYLIAIHAPTYILPAIAIIVGLHFIGMWLATDRRDHYLVVCAAMCALGVAAMFLPPPWQMQMAGLGSALILWLATYRQIVALPK